MNLKARYVLAALVLLALLFALCAGWWWMAGSTYQ